MGKGIYLQKEFIKEKYFLYQRIIFKYLLIQHICNIETP